MDNSPSRSSSLLKLIVLFALIGVFVWLFIARQDVMDWAKLRSYTPSSQVASINSTIALTPYGEKLFYVNHPEVDTDRATFAKQCPIDVEKTIVLGCYISGDNGIYLYDPADARLDGVTETTAAHEMLHAAYDRLPTKERQRVDGLLNDYYQNQLSDERIKRTIASYERAGAPLANEMHSIFGTEIQNLPAELETYYSQYFSDRKLVLVQLAKYQDEFTRREAQVAAYDAQLAVQKKRIAQIDAAVKSNLNRLNSIQAQLSAYESSGDFRSFNALIPTYNNLVDAYNNQLENYKSEITGYNNTVELRNNLAVEESELIEALSGAKETELDSL